MPLDIVTQGLVCSGECWSLATTLAQTGFQIGPRPSAGADQTLMYTKVAILIFGWIVAWVVAFSVLFPVFLRSSSWPRDAYGRCWAGFSGVFFLLPAILFSSELYFPPGNQGVLQYGPEALLAVLAIVCFVASLVIWQTPAERRQAGGNA